MKSIKQYLVFALGAVALMLPSTALAQNSGVEIWSQRCGMCHDQQPANRYSAEYWESIMTHMALTARLTTAQSDEVLNFLKSGARKVAALDVTGEDAVVVASSDAAFLPEAADGEAVFLEYCAPCHGKSGEGDGPAAVAFDPPPSDFTDPDGVKARTLEEVISMIATGGGGMPAFWANLSQEDLETVAEYIRSF